MHRVPKPEVSIVITTRDRIEMIGRAVESASDQTVQDLEVVVVDDGSIPAVELGRSDPRVSIVRLSEPRGVCAARNAGLARARGEWIVFLDDDDELLPDMVEASLQAAASSDLPPPIAILSCVRVEDEGGHVVDLRCPPSALPRGSHWFLDGKGEGRFRSERTLLAPVDVVRSIGGFDERFKAMEDRDFFLRLNAVCSLQGMQRETYRAVLHGGPKLLSQPLARAEGLDLTLRKHADLIGRDRVRHARMLGTMAIGYLLGGRWGLAIRSSAAAVARDPLHGRHYLQLGICLAGRRVFLLGSWVRRTLRRRPGLASSVRH
jgi:glycosyltransferase involved in cell wall biosynthesis